LNRPLIEEIHYFRIPVADLSVSVSWYTECLGLTLRRREGDKAVLELPAGALLVLVQADEHSRGHFSVDGQAEFSIGFSSPEIHRLRQHLSEQGVTVDEMKEDNGHFYFHFFDPSGNKLQAHW